MNLALSRGSLLVFIYSEHSCFPVDDRPTATLQLYPYLLASLIFDAAHVLWHIIPLSRVSYNTDKYQISGKRAVSPSSLRLQISVKKQDVYLLPAEVCAVNSTARGNSPDYFMSST